MVITLHILNIFTSFLVSPAEQGLWALGPTRAPAGGPGYYGCVDIRKMINKPMEDDEANKGWMTLGMDM